MKYKKLLSVFLGTTLLCSPIVNANQYKSVITKEHNKYDEGVLLSPIEDYEVPFYINQGLDIKGTYITTVGHSTSGEYSEWFINFGQKEYIESAVKRAGYNDVDPNRVDTLCGYEDKSNFCSIIGNTITDEFQLPTSGKYYFEMTLVDVNAKPQAFFFTDNWANTAPYHPVGYAMRYGSWSGNTYNNGHYSFNNEHQGIWIVGAEGFVKGDTYKVWIDFDENDLTIIQHGKEEASDYTNPIINPNYEE